jgi:hypothetical protein
MFQRRSVRVQNLRRIAVAFFCLQANATVMVVLVVPNLMNELASTVAERFPHEHAFMLAASFTEIGLLQVAIYVCAMQLARAHLAFVRFG